MSEIVRNIKFLNSAWLKRLFRGGGLGIQLSSCDKGLNIGLAWLWPVFGIRSGFQNMVWTSTSKITLKSNFSCSIYWPKFIAIQSNVSIFWLVCRKNWRWILSLLFEGPTRTRFFSQRSNPYPHPGKIQPDPEPCCNVCMRPWIKSWRTVRVSWLLTSDRRQGRIQDCHPIDILDIELQHTTVLL